MAVVVKSSDVPMLTNLLNEMGAENKLIAKKFAAEKVRELLSDLKRSFSGTAANKRVSDISRLVYLVQFKLVFKYGPNVALYLFIFCSFGTLIDGGDLKNINLFKTIGLNKSHADGMKTD